LYDTKSACHGGCFFDSRKPLGVKLPPRITDQHIVAFGNGIEKGKTQGEDAYSAIVPYAPPRQAWAAKITYHAQRGVLPTPHSC
jgi:hypothetical protein